MLAVTVLVKLLFFPLAYKSYVSMSAMKKLQPEMTKLRERYADNRSEEHTSELQSLMRISYAVFCLKKKKDKYKSSTTNDNDNKQSVNHISNRQIRNNYTPPQDID